MAVGELWRVSVIWDIGGFSQQLVNVFHYRQATASVEPFEPEDVANAVFESALPAVADCITSAISCSLIQVRSISDPTVGGDISFPTPITGTLVGEAYALQANPLIRWRTGLIGRHYQGRNWLPPATEGVVGGAGVVTGSYLTAVQAAATALMTIPAGMNHGGYDLIVYSPPNPDSVPPWGGDATVVTSFSVASHLKTQRRRAT